MLATKKLRGIHGFRWRRLGPWNLDQSLRANLIVSAAVLVAGVACGFLVITRGPIALVPSAVVLIAGLVTARFGRPSAPSVHARVWWMPWAWLALLLISEHRFENRSPTAVVGGELSGRVASELAIYALIAVTILALWPSFRSHNLFTGLILLILAWPTFALISVFWSVISRFTLVRSAQFLVPLMLGVSMIGLWKRHPETAEKLWWQSLRLFVNVITLLVFLGLATGTTASEFEGGASRFAWPGVHPITGAIYAGFALVAVIIGGRAFTKSSMLVHSTKIGLLTFGLIKSQTRGAVVAFLVALLMGLWVAGRNRPIVRLLGVPGLLVGGLVTWDMTRSQIVEYALRGSGQQGLETLNGRIPLWEIAADAITEGGRWLTGFGYGSSRVILFERMSWAGSAHNTWVELLMGVGLIGTLIAAAACFAIGRRLWRRAMAQGSRRDVMHLALFIYLIVCSLTAEILALPGFGFSALMLLAVAAHASQSIDPHRESYRVGRASTPVKIDHLLLAES